MDIEIREGVYPIALEIGNQEIARAFGALRPGNAQYGKGDEKYWPAETPTHINLFYEKFTFFALLKYAIFRLAACKFLFSKFSLSVIYYKKASLDKKNAPAPFFGPKRFLSERRYFITTLRFRTEFPSLTRIK